MGAQTEEFSEDEQGPGMHEPTFNAIQCMAEEQPVCKLREGWNSLPIASTDAVTFAPAGGETSDVATYDAAVSDVTTSEAVPGGSWLPKLAYNHLESSCGEETLQSLQQLQSHA